MGIRLRTRLCRKKTGLARKHEGTKDLRLVTNLSNIMSIGFSFIYHRDVLILLPLVAVFSGHCDNPHCDGLHHGIRIAWLFWDFDLVAQ